MNDHLPIYNSRLIKNYLEFLQEHYPAVHTASLLAYAGITSQQIADPAHWFTQREIDRFHEILEKQTSNPHVSREAGRYAAVSRAAGPLKRYVMGFMDPSTAYRLLAKITPHLTRGGSFTSRKLGANRMEVSFVPNPDVTENPRQCENRTGQLEAVSKIFTDAFAHVEHPVCVHRGGDACRYVVTWQESPAQSWRRLRNTMLAAGAGIGVGLGFVLPLWPWLCAVMLIGGLVLFCSQQAVRKERTQLEKRIALQGDDADVYLREMQLHYNHALFLNDLGRICSGASDVQALAKEVVGALENGSGFAAGLILLRDRDENALLWAAGYGCRGKKAVRLRENGLSLLETQHPFVRALGGSGKPQRDPLRGQCCGGPQRG